MNPEFTSSGEKLVGVEISNSLMIGVCLAANGEVAASHKILHERSETDPQNIADFINDLKKHFGGDFTKIGIAVPGLVRKDTKQVAYSTLIPEHSQINLLNALETATQLKVTIENDANAAAYGEYKLGAGRSNRNIFYATLGEGVGGALILDGEIWRGISGFAGEFGYLTLNSEGMKLEDVASTADIVRRTRSRFYQDSTSSLDEEKITVSDIIGEASKGDDFSQMMLDRTGSYVGTAVAGVINLLNIEKVVIGGEVMKAKDLILKAIIRRARELSFAPSFETVEIVSGELGENAAAIGAAILSVQSQES